MDMSSRWLAGIAGFAVLLADVGGVLAAERSGRFPAVCAQRDAKAFLLIEQHGEFQNMAPQKIYEAHRTMLEARAVCSEGRVTEALALYDSIDALGAVRSSRAQ